MATEEAESGIEPVTFQSCEGGHETSYIFVRMLGAGAFAEANLYRKIEVYATLNIVHHFFN